MEKEVTTTYLELRSLDTLRPATPKRDLVICKSEETVPELNRFLWAMVGSPVSWVDRLAWNREEWTEYVSRPEQQTLIAYINNTPSGFVDLVELETETEIAYLGLFPQFVGKGYGGHLLTEAIRITWTDRTERVWVETDNFDHSHSFNNYKARGFEVYKQSKEIKDMPEPKLYWP